MYVFGRASCWGSGWYTFWVHTSHLQQKTWVLLILGSNKHTDKLSCLPPKERESQTPCELFANKTAVRHCILRTNQYYDFHLNRPPRVAAEPHCHALTYRSFFFCICAHLYTNTNAHAAHICVYILLILPFLYLLLYINTYRKKSLNSLPKLTLHSIRVFYNAYFYKILKSCTKKDHFLFIYTFEGDISKILNPVILLRINIPLFQFWYIFITI